MSIHKPHTIPPCSIYIASGAQPAEAELTDEDIKKCNLFTEEEIQRMTVEELQYILSFTFEEVEVQVKRLREKS